jgi:hypothetical protein
MMNLAMRSFRRRSMNMEMIHPQRQTQIKKKLLLRGK